MNSLYEKFCIIAARLNSKVFIRNRFISLSGTFIQKYASACDWCKNVH